MSKIVINGGDFEVIRCDFVNGEFIFRSKNKHTPIERIPAVKIKTINVESENDCKDWFDACGLAAVGSLVLGPIGLLAGLLLGGKKKRICFVATFDDDRKILGTTDSEIYKKIRSAMMTVKTDQDCN
ncbi:hypothetical protein JD969_10920 [Planctomycetota bacterium]|nr:hypothetical protein JD969_10920 [Planctomycetota bacterium]